jgi:hypothetical protein
MVIQIVLKILFLVNFYVEYRFLQAFTIYYINCFPVYTLLTSISQVSLELNPLFEPVIGKL